MNFLITGGSGFIGSHLCHLLINDGHNVTILTRNVKKTANKFSSKGISGSDQDINDNRITFIDKLDDAKDGYDVIINLAGESIANGRWSANKKKKIYDSRLKTTQALIDYISHVKQKPKLLISGSAIGYYGSSESKEFTESSKAADNDFTHDLCRKWEDIASKAKKDGVRVCYIRTGIVLGIKGGALMQMMLPFKLCLGGKMGSGKQWMSWIHIDDIIGIIEHIINNEKITGAINAAAPNPITNAHFTKELGKALKRPAILPIPAFNLKLIFGEMAETILLKGQKVLPKKALDTGYKFKFPDIRQALKNLLQ